MTRQQAYRRFEGVRDELHAARFSLGRTLLAHRDDALVRQAAGREQITAHHLESCVGNLELTYLLRLFAEFEGVLRDYWLHGLHRTTRPQMTDLMNSIAAYCHTTDDDVNDAHEVREYRNAVIHEHAQDLRFEFRVCRSRLARFARWLPPEW